MRRREFIAGISATTAWPLLARAQQRPMPVIGFLAGGPPDPGAPSVAAFRQGLRELGYIEGRNILIEYRWAEGSRNGFPFSRPNWLRSRSMSS
jgi:putative ABC transport system substrate-binding protein